MVTTLQAYPSPDPCDKIDQASCKKASAVLIWPLQINAAGFFILASSNAYHAIEEKNESQVGYVYASGERRRVSQKPPS